MAQTPLSRTPPGSGTNTPLLAAYAPGALAKLVPAKRAKLLKKTPRGLMPNSPLASPADALGSGGA